MMRFSRIYSDDGRGDGAPTLDGLKVIDQIINGFKTAPEHAPITVLQSLSLPTATAVMAPRKEIADQGERYYAMAREDAARPLWIQLRSPGKSADLLKSWRSSLLAQTRYLVLGILAPSVEHAGITLWPGSRRSRSRDGRAGVGGLSRQDGGLSRSAQRTCPALSAVRSY